METYATRECAANVDAHYLINNTNVMTATVTARKHRGINNSMNKNNSEGVHTQTQNMGLFARGDRGRSTIIPTSTGQLERNRSCSRSQAKIEYMKTNGLRLQYYNDKATSGPAFIIERKDNRNNHPMHL